MCFCSREGLHMSKAECIERITEMIDGIEDEALLRRIYLIIVVITGADE